MNSIANRFHAIHGHMHPIHGWDSRDPWTHELSRRLLLGDSPTPEQIDRRSAEMHIDANTSPVFLCHALDDTAVPADNTLRMLSAMRNAHRPVEAHLLQEGGHAFGVGRPGTPSAQWIDLLCAWLDRTAGRDGCRRPAGPRRAAP